MVRRCPGFGHAWLRWRRRYGCHVHHPRDLPSVDALVGELAETDLPRPIVVEIARTAIDTARAELLGGAESVDPLATATAELAWCRKRRFERVINATGVLLHTNLGRAPIAIDAAEAAAHAAVNYGNVEFDLESGDRGGRGAYLNRLLVSLTGAEAALVVNNNAAALFLALASLARGRAVPVSRGELIEIGGSYRLPDLMAASGADLVEVGTTNRTRIGDFADAIDADTAMLLKVHPSNYRVMGFTQDTPLTELAALGAERGLPVVFDVGSGLLDENVPWIDGPPPTWVHGEPGVRQSLEAGADLVLFSGDKLLGGPQAGIVVGSADLVGQMKRFPIARALRTDKATTAALTRTLEHFSSGTVDAIPFWQMVTRGEEELAGRLKAIADLADVPADIRESNALPGAGSVPGMVVASPALAVEHVRADQLWRAGLDADPPVVVRREAGTILVDVRAVDPADDAHVAAVIKSACRS